MALTAVEEAQLRDLITQQSALLSLATSEAIIISKLGATKKNLSEVSAAVALGDTDLLFVRQGTTDKSISGAIVKAFADANIPSGNISATTKQAAINELDAEKALLAGSATQAFSATTAAAGTDTTQVATTAFVNAEIVADVGVANSAVVKTALNAAGSAPVYACRAWVNFNGTGTVAIRASGNVSSITDNGVGNYTVNFTTDMPDANYSAVGGQDLSNTTSIIACSSFLTTSVRLAIASNNALADPNSASVVIFR